MHPIPQDHGNAWVAKGAIERKGWSNELATENTIENTQKVANGKEIPGYCREIYRFVKYYNLAR